MHEIRYFSFPTVFETAENEKTKKKNISCKPWALDGGTQSNTLTHTNTHDHIWINERVHCFRHSAFVRWCMFNVDRRYDEQSHISFISVISFIYHLGFWGYSYTHAPDFSTKCPPFFQTILWSLSWIWTFEEKTVKRRVERIKKLVSAYSCVNSQLAHILLLMILFD